MNNKYFALIRTSSGQISFIKLLLISLFLFKSSGVNALTCPDGTASGWYAGNQVYSLHNSAAAACGNFDLSSIGYPHLSFSGVGANNECLLQNDQGGQVSGLLYVGEKCPQYYLSPHNISSGCGEGNPCNPADGEKFQREVDFISPDRSLEVVRHYSSLASNVDEYNALGPQWRHNYVRRLSHKDQEKRNFYGVRTSKTTPLDSPLLACVHGWNQVKDDIYSGKLATATPAYRDGSCDIELNGKIFISFPIYNTLNSAVSVGSMAPAYTVSKANGNLRLFRNPGGVWQNTVIDGSEFSEMADGWSVRDKAGNIEKYDSSGNLIFLKSSDHHELTFQYSSDNQLQSVVNEHGLSLSYIYNEEGFLTTVMTPDGDLTYSYDSKNRFSFVTFPDGTQKHYRYEDSRHPNHLTSLLDEKSTVFAAWSYDEEGRALSTEHAGGVERIQFTYNSNGTTTVTGWLGGQRTYAFEPVRGQLRISTVSGIACISCPSKEITSIVYDSNGFQDIVRDRLGIITDYDIDADGREIQRVEAKGTTEEKIITTEWHPTLNLPTKITEPKRETIIQYDAQGREVSRAVNQR